MSGGADASAAVLLPSRKRTAMRIQGIIPPVITPMQSNEDVETMAVNQNEVSDRQAAEASLRTFMRLPASQRSSVILRDVLGYSIEEIVATE